MRILIIKKLLFFLILVLITYKPCVYGEENKKSLKLLFFMRDPADVLGRAFITNQIKYFVQKDYDVYITYFNKKKVDKHINNFLQNYHLEDKFFYYQELINEPMNQRTFDIIICHSGADYAHHVLDLCNQNKLFGKLACFLRGWDLTWAIRKNLNKYTQLFQKADLFLPVCEYLKNYAIKLGCSKDKIIVQKSGIDCQQFKYREHEFYSDGDIVLVTTTSKSSFKGLTYTIYAAANIIKRYPKVKLIIVGSHKMQNIINKFPDSIKKNIISLGRLSHIKIPEIFDKAHIFIAASTTDKDGRQEGIPTALKEAMASGLPAVSTYHAGIPELIKDGQNGLLVKERDVNALAKKIEYLINNPQICTQIGQKARQVIETEHNLEIENDKFEKIIMSLVR